jgi:hypothetical protein
LNNKLIAPEVKITLSLCPFVPLRFCALFKHFPARPSFQETDFARPVGAVDGLPADGFSFFALHRRPQALCFVRAPHAFQR